MLTTFSVLIILASIGLFFFKDKLPQKFQSFRTPIVGILIGIFIFLLGKSTMFSREGHLYYVLSPTGHRTVISSPGLKIIFPFSTIQEWEKYIDVKGIQTNPDGSFTQSTEGIEGVIPNGISVRFVDKVTADVFVSVRFQIPTDSESFINLVETYRHPQNLINNTLIPTISEQMKNVTFMYSAEDYVTGGATDYRMTIEDALKNGGFVVEKVQISDTIYSDLTVDSNILGKKREIKEIRDMYKNKKVLVNGIPKRISHEINTNKIITAQVIIDEVDLDKDFENKLKEQRDISAQKIIEIQKISTARAAQQRIVAEGERDKASERVKQEKEQVQKLIAIETKVKEEESNRQLAEIALKTAKLEAEAKKVSADADSYKNSKLVQAGLTPQEKAQLDKEIAIGVATQLKELKLPEIYISGNQGKNDNNLLESLIGSNLAKSMMETKTTK